MGCVAEDLRCKELQRKSEVLQSLKKINFMHTQQSLLVNNLSEKQSGKGSNPVVHGLKSHLQQLLFG